MDTFCSGSLLNYQQERARDKNNRGAVKNKENEAAEIVDRPKVD
jgi:hypothetical protein